MLTYLPHSDTLNTRVDTLEHHRKQVRREGGIPKSGRLAEADDALVFSNLVVLDDAPRWMVRVGQLGESVAEGGPTLFHGAKLRRDSPAPVLKLSLRISAVLRAEILPLLLLLGNYALHPFGDQLVLRVEVAIKRHLVGLRRFCDRLDSDTPDALPMEQIASRHEDALADGYGRPALFAGLLSIDGNICLHDSFYPLLD